MRALSQFEQPWVAISAAHDAGIMHGETSRVTVNHVNVVEAENGLETRFCNVKITRQPAGILVAGDRVPIREDTQVFIAGSRRLRERRGFVRIENALLVSNGRLTLTIDEATVIK